jgi:hypothetical protein
MQQKKKKHTQTDPVHTHSPQACDDGLLHPACPEYSLLEVRMGTAVVANVHTGHEVPRACVAPASRVKSRGEASQQNSQDMIRLGKPGCQIRDEGTGGKKFEMNVYKV